jgi:hypothetical protein
LPVSRIGGIDHDICVKGNLCPKALFGIRLTPEPSKGQQYKEKRAP